MVPAAGEEQPLRVAREAQYPQRKPNISPLLGAKIFHRSLLRLENVIRPLVAIHDFYRESPRRRNGVLRTGCGVNNYS